MSTSRKGLWQLTVGEREASLRTLEKFVKSQGGDIVNVFAMLRKNPVFTERVAKLIIRGMWPNTKYHGKTRALVPEESFWGIDEWMWYFDASLNDFPFGFIEKKEILINKVLYDPCPFNPGKKMFETHFFFSGAVLIKDIALNVQGWRTLLDEFSQPKVNIYNWMEGQRPLSRYLQPAWYTFPVVSQITEDRSAGQDLSALDANMPEGYRRMNLIEAVTANVLYFTKNGKYLDQDLISKNKWESGDLVTVVGHEIGGIDLHSFLRSSSKNRTIGIRRL